VRAGLALVEAVAALPAPERLQARVGIATGLVVVGDLAGASPEHEVVGEAPNLAARLQALAAPDSVLIASTTRRLVGATFARDPVGSLRLKAGHRPYRCGGRPARTRRRHASMPRTATCR
jgi:class 3 adenylate cyclase